jgi:4-amino-4-deoxy-L-arabinose transferase-like glycosyltransferase
MILLGMSPRRSSHAEPRETLSKHPVRTCGLLLLISLAVRLALWWPVAASGMSPMYDEGAYITRAVGYGNVIKAYATGAQPTETDLAWAYRDGGWPPLHPLLIGVVFAVFGPSVGLARLVVALQSALTTCIVYILTQRLADRRSALVAAGLYIVYPSFLAYSHLLWSESTYVLVFLVALYFAVRAVEADRSRQRVTFALLCGLFLGLAGLTRAAVLPLLIVVPAWLGWSIGQRRHRVLLPIAAFVVSLVVLSPWLGTLWSRENRFVLLTTTAGYNLYLGNNPWSQEDQARGEVRAALEDYMSAHGVSRDEAGRALALAYIRDDLGGFFARCCQHARALWVPDWYVMRHVLYATYPPMSNAAVLALIAFFVSAIVVLLGGAAYGLNVRRTEFKHRGLLLACVVFGMLPSLPSIANSRMTFPLLAILLPATAVGLVTIVQRRGWGCGVIMLAATIAVMWILNPSLPSGAFGTRNQVSAHYAPVAGWLKRVFGASDITLKDRLLVRYVGDGTSGVMHLSIPTDNYTFQDSNTRELTWNDPNPGAITRVEIAAPSAAAPPSIRLTRSATNQAVTFQPVQPGAWRTWKPTGLAGIEYMWLGSASIPDEQVALLLQK